MNNNANFKNINFVEKYIGGENNDSLDNFNIQSNIITNEKTDYNRTIDYYNKLERDKNENNEYVERLDNEQTTTIYRINNFPTYVDDINYSNPIIYPKKYDPYFDYLDKKNIKSINTQIIKKKEYLNIDSSNRVSNSSLNIGKYLNVKDYGLEFKNNSSFLTIYFNSPLSEGEIIPNNFIILRGFKSYINYYQNLNFFFKNDSPIVTIDISPNFLQTISYVDITITIEGIGINDTTNYWKNIPYKLLNGIKKVFVNNFNSDFKLAFMLPINFYSLNQNENILISPCTITFNCLGNYPINLINANTPLTSLNLSNYLIVNNVSTDNITVILTNTLSLTQNIQLDGYWVDDSFFTGKNIQIGKIDGFVKAFESANYFSIFLNKTYVNVAEIKIISSEIPNIQTNINKNYDDVNDLNAKDSLSNQYNTEQFININSSTQNFNNKLYWENILDEGIYSIDLETGNYTYELLKEIIEYKVSLTKRIPLEPTDNLVLYNNMEVTFIKEIDETRFTMFDIYSIPNSFVELKSDTSSLQNSYTIKIFCIKHNLKIGDTVHINNSIDYYVIDKSYINSKEGHKVSNILNDDYFEITIKNINPIVDVGNTKGGYSLQLKKKAIFRLFFNYKDTFGKLIGFRLVGFESSITSYSNLFPYNTITNKQPYYNDVGSILIVNNNISPEILASTFENEEYYYFLLLVEGLNNNNNPNGPSYFYKFLINQPPGNYFFNTFVNSPVYFNPPLRNLNELTLSLVNPDGSLVNMGNLNYSLTFEITTINNAPENTNINTNMARI
jgi:hypothetical protein